MILTLGQPPVDSRLKVTDGYVDISDNIHWALFLNLIADILANVGPQLRVAAVLNFPNTLAGNSSDLSIAVPGALPGMPVSLGAPLPPGDTTYTAYAGTDIVKVRFMNSSAGAQDPASATFTVAVHTGETT